MAERNHVNPRFPANGLSLYGLRLLLVVLSMALNVSRVRGRAGMKSHSNTDSNTAVERTTDRFFSWLPRGKDLKDDSFYRRSENSFRMTNRTRCNWFSTAGEVDSFVRATRFPWRQPSIVDRATGTLRLTLPYWAAVPAHHLLTSNRGKGLALASVFCWMLQKCYTSEPVQRSFYFWKHAGPIVVHYKFTKWWLTASQANREKRDQVYESLHNQYAQPAYRIILHLRGLYVKMGQILSSRPDFMPYQYIHCFTNLQDKIPAFDTDLIQTTAIDALRRDCPAYDVYEDLVLDPMPLGSASIGQVHRATLRPKENADNQQNAPKEVAIKIMHQGAKEKFQNDFQVFRWLCRIAIPSWCRMLDALEQQVMTEFNYLQEAESLQTVRNNMLQSRYRNRVCIPEPMMELCCENVLVMELLQGKKVTEAIHDKLSMAMGNNQTRVQEFLKQRKYEVLMGGHDTSTSDAMLHDSVNLFGKWKLLRLFQQCRNVIDLLVDVHGYQIFRTGVWNGDPHFGNCLQLEDGRLGLIDYGQTRRMDDTQRRQFARIVVALHEDSNMQLTAAAMRAAGFATRNNTDDLMMCRYASLLFDSDEDSMKNGFCIPQEYFKSLMDENPILCIPDSAIFVGRTSLMFRGMGSAMGAMGQIRTASRWYPHAKQALLENGLRRPLENSTSSL